MNMEVQKKLLDGIVSEKHVNTEINGACKDPDRIPQKSMPIFNPTAKPQQQSLRIRLPNRQIADFSWLLDGKISKG